MANDPYATLGVAKTASAEEIRRAYRKLAKQNHPDLNPGNTAAEERFKAANSANDLLSDPDKRAKFDRGEIDGAGDPRHQAPPYGAYAQGPGGAKYSGGGSPFDGVDPADIFAEFLNQSGAAPGRGKAPRRGRDRAYSLEVDLLEAVNGATRRLTLPGGPAGQGGIDVEVRIPPGLEDGQTLRLKEKGDAGRNGAPAGDALIEVAVRPHPIFRRDGPDLLVELPITLAEAVLGGKVAVPTATGSVSLSIPPNSANGAKLRLRGRGVPAAGTRPAGDQYVTLKLVLDPSDAALAVFLRDRPDQPPFDPRAGMGSGA